LNDVAEIIFLVDSLAFVRPMLREAYSLKMKHMTRNKLSMQTPLAVGFSAM